MLRTIKRVAVVGVAGVSLMYFGGATHLHEKLHDMFEGNKPIAVGYENPGDVSIEKRVNEKGNVEGYVTFSNSEGTIELPILKGENGLQIGDSDYWWSTIGKQQRDGFVLKGWNDLSKFSKTSVVKNEFSNLDYSVMEELTERGWNSLNLEKRAEMVTNEWGNLEKSTRYPLVKGDLEQALDAFYGVNKNVDEKINELEVNENGDR